MGPGNSSSDPLFVPQSNRRVDACRASCRHEARSDHRSRQQQRHSHERDGVMGAEPVQPGIEEPAGSQGHKRSNHDAGEIRPATCGEDQAQHVSPARAKGDPDAELSGALRDQICVGSVNAQERQADRQASKRQKKIRPCLCQPELWVRLNLPLQGAQGQQWNRRIGCMDAVSHRLKQGGFLSRHGVMCDDEHSCGYRFTERQIDSWHGDPVKKPRPYRGDDTDHLVVSPGVRCSLSSGRRLRNANAPANCVLPRPQPAGGLLVDNRHTECMCSGGFGAQKLASRERHTHGSEVALSDCRSTCVAGWLIVVGAPNAGIRQFPLRGRDEARVTS